MSTDVVSLHEQIKKDLETQRDTVPAPASRNISLNGKVFTFPDGRTSEDPILAVILDHRNFNAYYTKPYDPKNPASPDCFAIAKEISSLKPHKNCEDPQADECHGCPRNEWGSSPIGRGKACRNTVRLAIAAPDSTADDEPMTLRIPPTAIKSWAALSNNLSAQGMVPIQIVTEIRFDPQAAFPRPILKAVRTHENLELFWSLREKAQAMLDTPPLVD